jgi:Putative glutamine amidotransferase
VTERVRVLFAGESWVTHSVHIKGFDSFEQSSYHEGGTAMIAALREGGVAVTYQPAHIAANSFPVSKDELRSFDVVILSDIGANTLVLPDRAFVHSERTPNRLSLLSEFVREGGSLLMVGGYLTFQGIQAKGNYHGTPVDDIPPQMTAARIRKGSHPSSSMPLIPPSLACPIGRIFLATTARSFVPTLTWWRASAITRSSQSDTSGRAARRSSRRTAGRIGGRLPFSIGPATPGFG